MQLKQLQDTKLNETLTLFFSSLHPPILSNLIPFSQRQVTLAWDDPANRNEHTCNAFKQRPRVTQ